MSDVPPGPAFLDGLEQAIEQTAPDLLDRAHANLERIRTGVGLAAEEWDLLRRGVLAYHLLFVEPALELRGAPLVAVDDAAEMQLLSLLHWRSVDALADTDNLQLSTYRQREIAFATSTRIRERAKSAGVDWQGPPGQQFRAFYQGSEMVPLGAAPAGAEITAAFLQEQFVLEPKGRMSFLFFTPQHLLRAADDEITWYKFYVSTLSLDDDIDDLLADAVAQRQTPVVRYLTRLGVFSPGRARKLPSYIRFLSEYLIRQLELCIRLAKQMDKRAALSVLSTLERSVQCKIQRM